MVPDEPARRVLRLGSVRPIRTEDREACERYECDEDPWDEQVARFIRTLVWRGRPSDEQTLVVFVDEDEPAPLYGFGSWKPVSIQLDDEDELQPAIRIPYFGVDRRFRRTLGEDGRSLAGRLYASVEEAARQQADPEGALPFELFCVEENENGRGFWESRGFQDVGEAHFKDVRYRRFVKWPYAAP